MSNPTTDLLATGDFVVLDTETTGLHAPAQILQIAVIAPCGKTILNELVIPVLPIPLEATAVHGLNAELCLSKGHPWQAVKERVMEAIGQQFVVTYNAKFDRYMMHCSDEAHKIAVTDYHEHAQWICAMEWYAEIYGDWDEYHQSYRWQKLSNALVQQGLLPSNAHDALGDCRMTLNLIRKLAQNLKPINW